MESKRKRKILFTKLLIPTKKIIDIEKYILVKRFNIKYKRYLKNEIFCRHFAGKFVYKKHCHTTTYFQDNLLFNKTEEYLNKLFTTDDSIRNLIKYILIYKDYVSYYCFPIITNFYYNDIIVRTREAHAEEFYNINFKNLKNKVEQSKDNGIIIYSKEKCKNDDESKDEKIDKSIFNENIRNQIDSYTPNKIECSKVNIKGNSLFISSTNENNINKIINELNDKENQNDINLEPLKQNNNNTTRNFKYKKILKINNLKNIKKLDEISQKLKDNTFKNDNYNNYISKYDEKNNNGFYKKKNKDNIKYINFSKKHNDKNLFYLNKNKSYVNIRHNSSLERTININRKIINSFERKSRNDKLKSNEKLNYFRNYIKNNLNKKEKNIKTPNGSLVLKLNKIIKINNNIININIIKNKNGKSMIENPDDNYNNKFNESINAQSNRIIKLKDINQINQINEHKMNKRKNNYIFSRNKHNSNSSRFFSTKKLFDINKIEKENMSSISKNNKFIFNKIHPNSVLRKFIVKPKANLIGKTIEHSKNFFNNENFIKALNLSSITNYKTYKNSSDKTFNIK